MYMTSVEKHNQFIQQICKSIAVPDRKNVNEDISRKTIEDEFDLQAELEKRYDELFGNGKKQNT